MVILASILARIDNDMLLSLSHTLSRYRYIASIHQEEYTSLPEVDESHTR